MKIRIASYFHFSRAERNGAVALCLLCAAVFVAPSVLEKFREKPVTDFSGFALQVEQFHAGYAASAASPGAVFYFNPNTATLDELLRLGLPERVAKGICKYRDKGGRFRRPEDFSKVYNLDAADFERLLPYIRLDEPEWEGRSERRVEHIQAEVFPFDPNTATADELRRLGLSDRLAANVLKYREKGGRFRDKEGFRKLYGLSEADYARLEPYLQLPIAADGASPRPVSYASGFNPGNGKKEPQPVDINQATEADWQQLPGIGAWRAKQILAFREQLGGFVSVAQVAETRNLPDSVFQQIKPWLKQESPVFRQLPINRATAEELDAHPMISRKQADLIVRYREQHGPFGRIDDLKNIAVFRDGIWLEKIRPYLKLD
ncbi:MAG: helix-hairpin-helix domain-containing protein [Saprospiraceae bacterium]|nr:helix-hairpin-helix domain-containing protein [Saprospiraceae bacterium]